MNRNNQYEEDDDYQHQQDYNNDQYNYGEGYDDDENQNMVIEGGQGNSPHRNDENVSL